jgi:hypothetical protein
VITYAESLGMPENRLEEIVRGKSRIVPPAGKKNVDLIEELARILS